MSIGLAGLIGWIGWIAWIAWIPSFSVFVFFRAPAASCCPCSSPHALGRNVRSILRSKQLLENLLQSFAVSLPQLSPHPHQPNTQKPTAKPRSCNMIADMSLGGWHEL